MRKIKYMSEKEKMYLSIGLAAGLVFAFAYFGNKYGVGTFLPPVAATAPAVEETTQATV